jgi:HPt (histidine-containing phosphotransfer) domain-containing protein
MLLEEPVDPLAEQFLIRTQEDIGRLNVLLDRAVNTDWALLKDSARICHSIHGAAAMFGFPQLSQAAQVLQGLMEDRLRNSTPSRSNAAVTALLDSANQLARALAEARGGAPAA